MFHYLRYRYVKTQMSAYVNGELDTRTRRMVSRMIDQDPRCYAEYQRYLQMHTELARDVPLIGRPSSESLGMIWESIAQELVTSQAAGNSVSPVRYRMGVVATLLITLIVLPFMLNAQAGYVPLVPDQPLPETVASSTATARNQQLPGVTQVALVYEMNTVAANDVVAVGLQNTPAPQTPIR